MPATDTTAFAEAASQPVDTLSSVLLFVGVAVLGAGVGVTVFAELVVAEVCATPTCSNMVFGIANDVLGPVAVIGAAMLAGGMLLPEIAGGEQS
ncbi:MAG: hypothetical protein ACOCQY_05015 [Halorhabdus sp.]